MSDLSIGLKGNSLVAVDDTNTAIAAQSGSLPVFATPYMIALMEKATCNAINPYLSEGESSVGTSINVSHVKASGRGAIIKAEAILEEIDGRRLVFSVCATEEDGTVIGKGNIERFVVGIDRFMKKVEEK